MQTFMIPWWPYLHQPQTALLGWLKIGAEGQMITFGDIITFNAASYFGFSGILKWLLIAILP